MFNVSHIAGDFVLFIVGTLTKVNPPWNGHKNCSPRLNKLLADVNITLTDIKKR